MHCRARAPPVPPSAPPLDAGAAPPLELGAGAPPVEAGAAAPPLDTAPPVPTTRAPPVDPTAPPVATAPPVPARGAAPVPSVFTSSAAHEATDSSTKAIGVFMLEYSAEKTTRRRSFRRCGRARKVSGVRDLTADLWAPAGALPWWHAADVTTANWLQIIATLVTGAAIGGGLLVRLKVAESTIRDLLRGRQKQGERIGVLEERQARLEGILEAPERVRRNTRQNLIPPPDESGSE